MSKNSGIIYELGNNRYGLAIHSEQNETFIKMKKVFVHVFTDIWCTIPELDSTGKKISTLKSKSLIKAIGLSD